jgi:hypothetical protein
VFFPGRPRGIWRLYILDVSVVSDMSVADLEGGVRGVRPPPKMYFRCLSYRVVLVNTARPDGAFLFVV